MRKIFYIVLFAQLFWANSLFSQSEIVEKPKKAWEIGIGGTAMQLNRVYITGFQKHEQGYDFNLKLRHVLYAGDIYVARELNKHFYLDLQGGPGWANVYDLNNNSSSRLFANASLGLQWRLSPLFNSKYIDPYIRLGANYLYRDFLVDYTGSEGVGSDMMNWVLRNVSNKDGADAKNLFGISGGVGVNMWLNNTVGIGLHANYIHMPAFISKQKNVADALQGGVRLIFRIGGEKKTRQSEQIFVDRIVEVPVERIVEVPVEKIVESPAVAQLCELLNNVYFEFDKADLTSDSENILDRVSEILKRETGKHFLITGFTDIRGGREYNLDLSRRRAKSVVDGLEKRGVPSDMLKSRGVGKSISYVPYNESHEVRLGDRKVTIEEVTVLDYWNYIPKKDY